jgi:hypothetical protein
MVARLGDDHARAQRLAAGLAEIPAVDVDPACVHTNILVFRLRPERMPGARETAPSQRLVAGLKERGVLCGAFGATEVRMVTHYEITDADVEATLRGVRRFESSQVRRFRIQVKGETGKVKGETKSARPVPCLPFDVYPLPFALTRSSRLWPSEPANL